MTATKTAKQEAYTHHEVADIYGVDLRTARDMIKGGLIRGGWQAPGRPSLWLVSHAELMRHARGSWGNFQHVLDRIDGLEPEEISLIYRAK